MTYELIKPYIEKKLVSEQVHPENPDIRIFNYTQMCQFAKAWDDVTRQCRGLIMNVKTGEILARPFPKFFNYGEHLEKGWEIPNEQPVVFEKLDGSLGILYALNGKPWIATRGSFTSDQAIWATEWYRKNVNILPGQEATHLFEIIYPENRIVVNYDYSGLVWLASIETKTGASLDSWRSAWERVMRVASKVDFKSIEELAALDIPNSEGFVILFPKANIRMKVKFPEYVRLHRIVTGVNEIAIWETMRGGGNLNEFLEKVPDEFHDWVESVQKRLWAEFAELWGKAMLAREMVQGKERKEQAQWIMQNAKSVSGIVFCLLDGNDKKAIDGVYRMIRPNGAKVFKTDIDL